MADEEIIIPDEDDEDYETDVIDESLLQGTEPSVQDLLKDYETRKQSYATTHHLTKYEKTKILAERSQQLSNGSPPFVDIKGTPRNTYEIALQELHEHKIPFLLKRPYGNGYEIWKVSDLS
jgi:DNA-directed RNA polymerase subunit K/omega